MVVPSAENDFVSDFGHKAYHLHLHFCISPLHELIYLCFTILSYCFVTESNSLFFSMMYMMISD